MSDGPAVLEMPYHETRAVTKGMRFALRALQTGAVAVVLAAVTWKTFELDRYFVPKELVLHLTALAAGLGALATLRRLRFSRIDLFLAAYLLLGALSAIFATNGWYATRALAVTASGLAVFWAARAVTAAGLERRLLTAFSVAIVIGAGTSLLQAYGVRIDLFSLNRAPGGTLGNRNFVAHMAAFGLPVVLLTALRAYQFRGYLLGAIGTGLVAAALALSRSRAGFLAVAAVLIVFLAAPVVSPPLRRHGRTWARLAGILLLAGGGVAGALILPNTLRWRSEYLESLTGVANYQEGSGRGRLVQYRQSLVMAIRNPLLGVGPGNWPVEYPAHAARRDPSLDGGEPGTTSNPWPSSDWVAAIAERGIPAAALLVLAMIGIALGGMQQLVEARRPDDGLGAAALLATLLAANVAGTFDAVLLLGLPALLVWATMGALWVPGVEPAARAHAEHALAVAVAAHGPPPAIGRDVFPGMLSHEDAATLHGAPPPPPQEPDASAGPTWRRRASPAALNAVALVAVLFIAAIGVFRSTAQLVAMGIYANRSDTTSLASAARIDPGNYRLRLRLARGGSGLGRAQRCVHARAAHELQPNAEAARALNRRCRG